MFTSVQPTNFTVNNSNFSSQLKKIIQLSIRHVRQRKILTFQMFKLPVTATRTKQLHCL